MTKKHLLPITIAALLGAYACNSDSADYEYTPSSSAIVKAFSLSENSQVLDSLSNVFFSIDLVNAQIFNADSLPYGTKVDKLIPVIETVANVQMVQLEVPRPNMSDSIMDFLKNSMDSVDFSNGPVKLRIKSQSGTVEKLYEIRVNVHQVKPDTLAWGKLEYNNSAVPTPYSAPSAVKVVQCDGSFYSLSANSGGSEATLYKSDSPEWASYTTESTITAFTPKVESLCAVGNTLYLLDTDSNLYSYASGQWTATGAKMHNLYGEYKQDLMGCRNDGGNWSIVAYPSGKSWAMPAAFPVSGTSQPVTYSAAMAANPQMIITGGRDASGNLTAATWGFDGSNWACYKVNSLPEAVEGICIVAYDLFYVPNTTWRPVQYPALLAFGGLAESGETNRTVYMSQDWGMTWKKAPELVQLPASVPSTSQASALVHNYTLTTTTPASKAERWSEVATPAIPNFCNWVDAPISRVEKPITEWDCPVIYVYGGKLANGTPTTQAWRAAILRYTFTPKY